jgi:hypothetical protein
MNLEQLQRAVLGLIQQPLTPSERTRARTRDGRSVRKIAEKIIKPNDRLTSVERLEIYNRVYWFRILSSLAEDFPGLRAVIGQRRFDKLLVAYLTDCPSRSFTLRNLGSRLESWLRQHSGLTRGVRRLALDMVRLEWADIEAYDADELPHLSVGDLGSLGEDSRLTLQPYIFLLDCAYPVDDLVIAVRDAADEEEKETASNVFVEGASHAHMRRVRLPKPEKTWIAVHRQDLVVYFKRLEPEAFALLRALQQGKTLGDAVEAAAGGSLRKARHIAGQLQNWFALWASLGWFCRPEASDKR